MKRKLIILLIVILVLAAIASAGYLGLRSGQPLAAVTPQAPATVPVTVCDVEQTVTAPGSLINTRETKIEMPSTGRLSEVFVRAGDSVKAGQVLTRVGNKAQFEADVAAAKLALLQAQQAQDDLYKDSPLKTAQALVAVADAQAALDKARAERTRLDYPRASQAAIDEAEAKLALADQQLAQAQTVYETLRNRPADDPQRAAALLNLTNAQRAQQAAAANLNWLVSHPDPDEKAAADDRVTLAEAQLVQAQADWLSLKDGPMPLEVAQAEAQINDAQAKLTQAEEALAHLDIKAPFKGVILEVTARPGETIPAGTPLFTLNNPEDVEVESTVVEEDYPYIELGQPVSLYFDALPSETITGTIAGIVPKRAPGDRPLYYVYIGLDHVPGKLVAGMSADASIVIAQRKGVLCLPRAIAKASSNSTAVVEVWANWQKEKRQVQVGLRGDTYVEIVSGLKEGEQVVAR